MEQDYKSFAMHFISHLVYALNHFLNVRDHRVGYAGEII